MKNLHQLKKTGMLVMPDVLKARLLQYRQDYDDCRFRYYPNYNPPRLVACYQYLDEDEDGDELWMSTEWEQVNPMPEYYIYLYPIQSFEWGTDIEIMS
jgi:hypothetical protein